MVILRRVHGASSAAGVGHEVKYMRKGDCIMNQNRIDSFRGAHRFLSNFFPAEVSYEGAIYPSVENAFQAAKCMDASERTVFAVCSPAEAKRFGRRVRLLATGSAELIEGNVWNDTFWGVCRGRGQNHLGRILMEVRDGLRGGSL